MSDNDKTYLVEAKNRRDFLAVARKTYEGHTYVDLRTVTAGEGEGQYLPSKKGCTIPPRVLPTIIAALREAEADLIAEGLIEGDAA